MQPHFITKPALTVVGTLVLARPMAPKNPNLWQQFGSGLGEVPHLAEHSVAYGWMDYFVQTTGQFDYMAGTAVVKANELSTGMTRWDVPANTHDAMCNFT